MRWKTLALAAGLYCLLFSGENVHQSPKLSQADERVADKPPHVVEVARCRIKLAESVVLAANIAGIVSALDVPEGMPAETGGTVARLKDDVSRAQLAIAEKEAENDIDIRYAHKAAELAKAELEKAELANQRVVGAIPDVEIRRLRLAAERSVLQIEQAEHTLAVNRLKRDEAAAQLATHRIAAPFAGTVTRVLKRAGEAVRQGDPILELVSTRRVRIEGEVEIADAVQLKAGMPFEVWLDLPDVELDIEQRRFSGELRFIDVAAEPVTRRVRIWGEAENTENVLRAGLTARMRIDLKGLAANNVRR